MGDLAFTNVVVRNVDVEKDVEIFFLKNKDLL